MKTKNMNKKTAKEYWRQNIKYLVILLTIWFTVSFGFGILLIDELNQFKIGGFKLGFWFALIFFTIFYTISLDLEEKLFEKI